VILDSSAIVAILTDEPAAGEILDKLRGSQAIGVGAPTLVESALVLSARLERSSRDLLERFLAELEVVTIPFGEAHWREAAEAFRRFGKGRHPAALNFGDCMTYAVARLAQKPLVCVGEDFPLTDLELA
jgi:ribonuclease VapC